MNSLPTPLRRQLEKAVQQARSLAEAGARHALEALAVQEPDPYPHMNDAQRGLRRRLRAQARQLGDGESRQKPGAYEIQHLAEKLAYDQWHRLLFARYLLENNLLISPEHGVAVALDDCEELAPALVLKDAWAVAARFAAKELPEIFRADDPAGAVEQSVNDRQPLIALVTGLPVEVFTASDSLGWCYQFWQAEKKDAVNAAGNKIGADELPAVTQLFTEDYMVDFLLDNTLGAWWAGKRMKDEGGRMNYETEEACRAAVALPGCPWKYLRFLKVPPTGEAADPTSSFIIHPSSFHWTPAAGAFDGWPKTAKELKCLDPCMGSGHFIVALFERLVTLRRAEEALDEADAVAAVIRDNLFGLEIDPRCTQIAAFNLALAAWRRVGHCPLPPMNLACSGLAPNAKQADWLALAGDDDRMQRGMAKLYTLFKDAPVLGSLINPRLASADLVEAGFHELQPLLEQALAQESKDDTTHEMAVTARGLAKAAEILAGQFTLVATNVPYLGFHKQVEVLSGYCKRVYPYAKADLATCFVERSLSFCSRGCSVALVKPQNVLFLKTYAAFRKNQLANTRCQMFVKLGAKAFKTPMWDFGVSLDVVTNTVPEPTSHFAGMDVGKHLDPEAKSAALMKDMLFVGCQLDQLKNPDAAIVFFEVSYLDLLFKYAESLTGAHTLDIARFRLNFWEIELVTKKWNLHTSTPDAGRYFSGMEYISYTRAQGEAFADLAAAMKEEGFLGGWLSGNKAWGKVGIACSWMGQLPVGFYLGLFGILRDNKI